MGAPTAQMFRHNYENDVYYYVCCDARDLISTGIVDHEMLSTLSVPAYVRGFHVYRTYWTPKEGDILSTARDRLNPHDKFAVSVLDGNIIVGHLPKEISRVCAYFIKRGTIQCEVTDSKHRRSEIAKGGLEIPALLIFFGEKEDITRLKWLLHCLNYISTCT